MRNETPTEFIARIKAEYPDKSYSNDDLLVSRLKDIEAKYYDGKETRINKTMQMLKEDYCYYLVKSYWDVLPEDIKNRIESGKIDFGLIEDQRPYIQCHHLGNKDFAILFSRGLQRILYSIIRTFSTRITNIDGSKNELGISFEETVSIMEDDFYVFERTFTLYPRHGVELSKNQITFAYKACVIAEMFFLCHEFMHVLFSEVDFDGELTDRNEEYLADYFALYKCFSMNESSNQEFVYMSCEYALLVFSILDKLGLLPQNTTHPTFSERISALRTHLKQDIKDEDTFRAIINLGDVTEKVFNNITGNIISETEAYKMFLLEKQKHITQKIHELLNKYWNWRNTVPDYSNFNIQMTDLLNLGYYKIINNILIDLFEQNRSYCKGVSEKNSNSLPDDYVEKFNKMKLIISFVKSLDEPMKTVFKNVTASLSQNSQ